MPFKSNQIKSNLFRLKFSTQYNNEFALRLAGQAGDNFALMSALDDICWHIQIMEKTA